MTGGTALAGQRPALRRRHLAAILAALYALSIFAEPPDFADYFYLWLDHIERTGRVGAFSEPFANYTPPYLYLMAAASALPLSHLLILKLLATLSAAWAGLGILRLIRALGGETDWSAALFALSLPTVIFNGPVLGQCDGIWAGSCLLALASATERRVFAAAAWAGVAFAFKAQAAFVAPIIMGVVLRERAWGAFILPPMIYMLAVAPAWLAGWPLSDLLTIYIKQASEPFEGNAPNIWAIPVALGFTGPFDAGYVLGVLLAGGMIFLAAQQGANPQIALLCVIALPFVLPKMHERYFYLADVLAFSIAWVRRDLPSISCCALVQAASVASIVAYLGPLPWLNGLASIVMAAALSIAVHQAFFAKGSVPRHQSST